MFASFDAGGFDDSARDNIFDPTLLENRHPDLFGGPTRLGSPGEISAILIQTLPLLWGESSWLEFAVTRNRSYIELSLIVGSLRPLCSREGRKAIRADGHAAVTGMSLGCFAQTPDVLTLLSRWDPGRLTPRCCFQWIRGCPGVQRSRESPGQGRPVVD